MKLQWQVTGAHIDSVDPSYVLHPGRAFTVKLAESPVTTEFLLPRIEDYLAGRPLAKLP
jgi:hypothetical protein